MDKKNLIAISLIAVLWVGYFILFKPEQPSRKTESKKAETVAGKTDTTAKGAAPIAIKAVPAGGTEKLLTVKTKKFAMTLSSRGAAITECKYIERNIDLIVKENPFGAKGVLDFAVDFSDDDFVNGNPLTTSIWMHRQEGNTITYYTNMQVNGNPVRIEKAYIFPEDGYGFRVEYRLTNYGRNSIPLKNGSVIFSPGDLLGPALNYDNSYNRLMSIYSLNGSFEKEDKGGGSFLGCGLSSGGEPLEKETGTTNWIGVMSRYFLVIMVPEGGAGSGVIWENRKQAGFRTGINVPVNSLEPGKEISKNFKVYLGEKDKKKLASVDSSIIDAADVSKIIEPIRDFVIWSLFYINKLVGNLGWALVIFSLVTKLVFLPLTIKSTESMKKMQQLGPKMNELKAKYKDKPDVMQQEMMKMYKENKVNPMGGCFPLLLQMPFFFALYSALIDSIDLWRAPFIFWMKDLSMPDTVLTIAGFNLNILPIIMTATTFVQQKLSSVDAGSQQQKMMLMMMPVMFIFIFWSMPSGLVLYWALQNIFQIAHQVFINFRAKKEKKD